MDVDWKAYYDARVVEIGPEDLLSHVGHTVHGKPIAPDHLQALQDQMAEELSLGPDARLLDLCCGNGIFTRAMAEKAGSALGVDLSDGMIETARQANPAPNLRYEQMDATTVASLAGCPEAPFTHTVIYAAWQHFSVEAARKILEGICAVSVSDLRVFLGFVPDVALKDNFLDTPERRASYAAHVAAGRDAFDTWWDRDVLTAMAADLGLTCRYSDLPEQVHASSYRFNATLTRA